MATATTSPAIEGWFTTGERPALVGTRCAACRTVFFPREAAFCRNPGCTGETFDEVELSRQGRVWSYTDARYQPPPPYIPRVEPYEPFALAAVELEAEGLVVLGQVADGYGVDDLTVGAQVELVVEPLYTDDEGVSRTIWRWRPLAPAAAGAEGPASDTAAGEGNR
ncbi:MAG: OB-fold domain-containing protein [Acidimicrobiales bacterium]|nr:OB-fold domain-containing protein [Acidimicrobiales bacterium]